VENCFGELQGAIRARDVRPGGVLTQKTAPLERVANGAAERVHLRLVINDDWKYDWVLPVVRYDSTEGLLASLDDVVVAPAEAKVLDPRARRLAALE
jgi:hypothetical protein